LGGIGGGGGDGGVGWVSFFFLRTRRKKDVFIVNGWVGGWKGLREIMARLYMRP
jgi:hypothetical protein